MTSGPVDVHVDSEELQVLRNTLQQLQAELAGSGKPDVVDQQSMGGAYAYALIDDFCAAWQQARDDLVNRLAGLTAFVQNAVNEYEATEKLLRGAASRTET